ncbi:MAG TPA: dihydrodipicolinate synthetase [Bacteroidales bacterium]|nr:dihydrodipicolinate synthetase [Bacteroidales bacterium]HBZ21377.1 dihydrodipicolinate synthetase [Bacteroidales bacterium]
MFKIQKYEGLVAAPFTPMDKAGNINYDLIRPYYEFLEKRGVRGAFINGTTGEGASLTQIEKRLQAEKWAECYKSGGKVRIINLVGGTSYRECIENAVFSYETGVSAIAIVAPYYFKPADAGQLADFCIRIGESVPEIPVYFYHIPALTNVSMPMISFLENISANLRNFAGIKYTHEDFTDFQHCLNYNNRSFDLLWGSDASLFSALSLGCRGAVGSTYNYAAPLYLDLIKAFDNGNPDEAQRLQLLSVKIVSLLEKYGGIATGKAFMKYVGLDCGEFRSPVKNMSDYMYSEFIKDVRAMNMDNYLPKF